MFNKPQLIVRIKLSKPLYLRPLHESVAKEKLDEISLIEAGNEANNELLASFPTKSSGISTIFTRHPTPAKVSIYYLPLLTLRSTTLELPSAPAFVELSFQGV